MSQRVKAEYRFVGKNWRVIIRANSLTEAVQKLKSFGNGKYASDPEAYYLKPTRVSLHGLGIN